MFDHDQGSNGTFKLILEDPTNTFEVGKHGPLMRCPLNALFHSQVSPSMGINEASFLIRVSDPAKLDFEAVRTVNMTLVARYILLSTLQPSF